LSKADSSELKRRWRWLPWAAGALAVLAVIAGLAWREHRLAYRLLIAEPSEIAKSPELVRYAEGLAKPAYARHCASCHGKDLEGDHQRGAPNLKDGVWLYENGNVGEIERTLLYGVRSGNAKSRNITDMPALGRTLQLSPAEAADVTTYVLALSGGRRGDPEAARRGALIFQGKGVCYDCHAGDASGNPDYGAPALNDAEWLYGGDGQSVYQSVYSGRHGVCPAWIGKLKPKVIRALSVWLNQTSHQKGQGHG
jgi:cytochrome c oxidase cbb3-type subunit 3